ncbi:MAG: serine/threonine-protein kinase [Deltaproteobacteria bacterium]|jgi:serine/threonine protein kinase
MSSGPPPSSEPSGAAEDDATSQSETVRPSAFTPEEDALTDPPHARIEALGGTIRTIPAGAAPSDAMDAEGDTRADDSPFAGLLAEAKSETDMTPQPEDEEEEKTDGPHTKRIRPELEPDEPLPRAVADTVAEQPAMTERRVGPYRVLEELGSGGMAVVYKAVQPALDRLVAIKELRAEYVHDKQIATRFEREATSLATLQHGNIVHVYDYLKDLESAYIVMEYVDGIDLFDVLAESDKVPPDIAAIVAAEVAEGLEYAHYRGIVHRDIKPSNILLSKRGEVKIMDFGIARDPGKSELTQVGLAVGTPAYMAPEQIRGDTIDFRTDVFALGICLYEMLSGHKPWPEEEGRSVTVKVLDEPYVPLEKTAPGVPPELSQIVSRCLAKDPGRRFATTYELRSALESYATREVRSDPRTRIALYLRNRGFISDAEAANFVDTTLLNDASMRRRDEGIPLPPADVLLKPVGLAHALALAVIVIAGLLAVFFPIGQSLEGTARAAPDTGAAAPPVDVEAVVAQRVAEELAKRPTPKAAPSRGALGKNAAPRAPLNGDEGFVRVVVKPWARVFVDGDFYDYTPFANAIPLGPGRHRIGLRNPYYEGVDRYVEVETGKTQTVKISLIAKDQAETADR